MTFEEIEKIRKDYCQKRRKIRRQTFFIVGLLGLMFFGLILAWCISISSTSAFGNNPVFYSFLIALIIAAIVYAVSILIIQSRIKKTPNLFNDAYKTYFVEGELKKVFGNVTYEYKKGMPTETMEQILSTGDRYSSSDLVSASYKDIRFMGANVCTERNDGLSDIDKTIKYSTMFKGQVFIFDAGKNFPDHHQILSRDFTENVLLIKLNENLKKFEQVEIQTGEFDRKFKIFTQNKTDACTFFDSKFIEKIQKLYEKCNCFPLLLVFAGEKIYAAIDTQKYLFETPDSNQTLNETTETNKVKTDLSMIIDFIETLCVSNKESEER